MERELGERWVKGAARTVWRGAAWLTLGGSLVLACFNGCTISPPDDKATAGSGAESTTGGAVTGNAGAATSTGGAASSGAAAMNGGKSSIEPEAGAGNEPLAGAGGADTSTDPVANGKPCSVNARLREQPMRRRRVLRSAL